MGSNPTLSAINLTFSNHKCGVKIGLVALWSQMKKFFKPNALNFFLLGLVILLALLGIGFILELFGMDGAQMTLIPLMGIPIILFFISGVYFLVYFFKSISKGSKEVSSFLKANKESYFIVFHFPQPGRKGGRFKHHNRILAYCLGVL